MSDAVDEKPKIDGAGAEGEDVKPKDKGETITIRVKDQTGEETFFKIKQSTRMEKVRAPFFNTFSPRALRTHRALPRRCSRRTRPARV